MFDRSGCGTAGVMDFGGVLLLKAARKLGTIDSDEHTPVYARIVDPNDYAPLYLSDYDITFMSPPQTSTTPITEPKCEDYTCRDPASPLDSM